MPSDKKSNVPENLRNLAMATSIMPNKAPAYKNIL